MLWYKKTTASIVDSPPPPPPSPSPPPPPSPRAEWNRGSPPPLNFKNTDKSSQAAPKEMRCWRCCILLAPVALHEGERCVVSELLCGCVVRSVEGRSRGWAVRCICIVIYVLMDTVRCDIRTEQKNSQSGQSRPPPQNTHSLFVIYLVLLWGGPAGVGVDPAVHLARGGACSGMETCGGNNGGGESCLDWTYVLPKWA